MEIIVGVIGFIIGIAIGEAMQAEDDDNRLTKELKGISKREMERKGNE